MKSKKHDLPAMPFYFGDWRKAPDIRALDLDVRMIWFEMLGYMWESTERGYLTINGKPPSRDILARMLGIDITKLDQSLEQMLGMNVYSVRESDGAIYCRKMVHDTEISIKRAVSGRKGMKKRYSNNTIQSFDITKEVTNTESEIENEIESVVEIKKGGVGEKTESSNPSPASMYHPDQARDTREGVYAITRYLNSKTGGTLNPEHPGYCSSIWRRLQDGYTFDQMKAIIDTKVAEWLNDRRMRIHLNPTTLFSEENFDKYLNETTLPPIKDEEPAERRAYSPSIDHIKIYDKV